MFTHQFGPALLLETGHLGGWHAPVSKYGLLGGWPAPVPEADRHGG